MSQLPANRSFSDLSERAGSAERADATNAEDMREFAAEEPLAVASPEDSDAPMFKRALVSIMDELRAMDERRLIAINVDVRAACHVVLGTQPAILALRAEMVARFGEADACIVDRLELLARAAAQAQADYITADLGYDVKPLADEGVRMRSTLVAELASLGVRGVVVPSQVGPLKFGRGHKNIAFDLLQLVSFYRRNWAVIEPASGLKSTDIERAEGLANRLVIAAGRNSRQQCSAAADVRQRAYTLLHETYYEVRRMVIYLRFRKGDADQIAPSWFALRRNKRTKRNASPSIPGIDLGPTGETPRELDETARPDASAPHATLAGRADN